MVSGKGGPMSSGVEGEVNSGPNHAASDGRVAALLPWGGRASMTPSRRLACVLDLITAGDQRLETLDGGPRDVSSRTVERDMPRKTASGLGCRRRVERCAAMRLLVEGSPIDMASLRVSIDRDGGIRTSRP